MNYLEAYFDAVETTLRAVRETQGDAIARAAGLVAGALAGGGAWFVMDTGHMLQHEAIRRAGGLVGLTSFNYALEITGALPTRSGGAPDADAAELEALLVRAALENSTLRAGDVLLINSNSGRSANVIEVALQCRGRGIRTLGLASRAQMAACAAGHRGGHKLDAVVDVFLDNGGPVGDAAVPVRDNEAMCPMSGIGSAYVFWAVHAAVIGELEARGVSPTIYRSVHTGSEAFMAAQEQQFRERGI